MEKHSFSLLFQVKKHFLCLFLYLKHRKPSYPVENSIKTILDSQASCISVEAYVLKISHQHLCTKKLWKEEGKNYTSNQKSTCINYRLLNCWFQWKMQKLCAFVNLLMFVWNDQTKINQKDQLTQTKINTTAINQKSKEFRVDKKTRPTGNITQ